MAFISSRVSTLQIHGRPTSIARSELRALPTQFPSLKLDNACSKPIRRPQRASSTRCVAEAEEAASPRAHADLKELRYKRVMLKVSGEALEGSGTYGIDPAVLKSVAKEVAAASREGVEIAIVVGGGNFFRGVNRWDGLERTTADYVGMLATVMNAICLQSALEAEGVATRVQTAIEMQAVAEPYIRRRAIRHLEKGRVVIFGAGTGNPFFTTDTAAALRAAEIGADAYFKATKVDGVYDCDPVKHPERAKLHRRLSFREVMMNNLEVMDETAITLCKENNIPVVVFNLTRPGNIVQALMGNSEIGTCIECASEEGDEDSDHQEW
jgi:uridylate kinase